MVPQQGAVLTEPWREFHAVLHIRRISARRYPETQKAACAAFQRRSAAIRLALARLETRIALADHENLAAATHDLAIAMAGLGGLERRKHFHWKPRGERA